jgi:hypothetical protein
MIRSITKNVIVGGAVALASIASLTIAVVAQTPAPTTAPAGAKPTIVRTTGMWVEGPGFDIKYGGTYDQCADRCVAEASCVMIEYYKPEFKCNMYNEMRPLKTGGDSIVGTKKSPKAAKP